MAGQGRAGPGGAWQGMAGRGAAGLGEARQGKGDISYRNEAAACQRSPFTRGEAPDPPLRFDGPEYVPELDRVRLTGQILRVFDCLKSGRWMTLSEIARETGDPEASISAQARHLRKARNGAHRVDKRRRGEGERGLWEYRLTPAQDYVGPA